MVRRTSEVVGRVHAGGRRPLLVGGDCPVLLGALAALRGAHGRAGLVMVDGHEDAWPPPDSPTGEAADSELAIALGDVPGLPDGLAPVAGVVEAADVVLIGPRDAGELARAGAASVLGRLGTAVAGPDVPARPAAVTATALGDLEAPVLWLHVDLDVLATSAFPAADYLQDGGLSWRQLREVTRTAWADPRCAGASVVIYDPDLDPDRSTAADVVGFVGDLVAG